MRRLDLIGVVLMLAVSACGKKGDTETGTTNASASGSKPAPSASAAALWTKGQPVDAAVLEKLGNAATDCKVKTGKDYGPDWDCPAIKTYSAAISSVAMNEQGKLDSAVGPKLLASPSPAVRALGASALSSIIGTDAASGDVIADAMGKESDPAVLDTMIRNAASAAPKSAKVASAILATAGHADKFVRFHAAVAMGRPGVPAYTPKLAELAEKDAEQDVKDTACEGLGKHGDAALPTLDHLTKDGAAKGFSACFSGLMTQWVSYPDFETGSEKAYKLWLQRLGTKPRSSALGGGLRYVAYLGDEKNDKAVAWRKKNAWFKPADLVKALGDVIADPAADFSVTHAALEAAVANGAAKKDLQAWRKTMGDKPGVKQTSIAKSLDDAIAKAK